jgi:hypothetical protein
VCIATNCSWSFVYWVIILEGIFVTSCVLFYCVCTAVLHTLVAGLLARSQYPEGSVNNHLRTGFSWFPYVCKRTLRWFPRLQVATACFSCSPPDLNFFDPYFIFMYMRYNHCHRMTAHLQLNILLLLLFYCLQYAQGMEKLYKQMWELHSHGERPDHIVDKYALQAPSILCLEVLPPTYQYVYLFML